MATGYSTIESGKAQMASKTKYAVLASLAAVAVAIICVLAVVGTSDYNSVPQYEELAKSSKAKLKPVKYGDTVTLMNVYNNYLVVSLNGRTFTAGYLGKNDQIKIVSPTGKKGGVKYGDVVALVGQNNRYFTVRYSAKLTCRSAAITKASQFLVGGGKGALNVGGRLTLKTMFGYLTATPGGLRGDTPLVTSLEEYTVGEPGKETGHPARPGLTYGMTVSLKNVYQEFMQSDANGWVYLRASNGKWDHFDILSPLHREGPVSYGDQVLLRAHNTKLVSVRPGGGLEAVKQTPDLSCVFTLVGKSGIVHNDASVAFRSAAGYINAAAGAQRAQIDGSGHYQANFNFVISFSLKMKVA
jgi:hypothetical protein